MPVAKLISLQAFTFLFLALPLPLLVLSPHMEDLVQVEFYTPTEHDSHLFRSLANTFHLFS